MIHKLWFKVGATAVILALAVASFSQFGIGSELLFAIAAAWVALIAVWWKWKDIDGNEYK
ncbi:MAG: hypothetical protein HYY60_00670 [Parcubacteria group bacterium]|nr:hypothetical protein [Parcubacteria group bacterium]MBI3075174.1 hypothetical protein [Parcubacteria group bacterium]